MPPLPRIFRGIILYRLGYSPQRPYPWRWTTPIVLCAFLVLTGVLTAINVPLSAYNIEQQPTFRPNDTLPPLPFSKMVPDILQDTTGGFTPQTISVGDRIQLNNSIFNFTIVEAFDVLNNNQPISSFAYYNNPFSDGCDVTNLTAEIRNNTEAPIIEYNLELTATVRCRIPTSFTLLWSAIVGPPLPLGTPAREDLNSLTQDLAIVSTIWAKQSGLITYKIDVEPCCACSAVASTGANPAGESFDPVQPPCSSLPVNPAVSVTTSTFPVGVEASGGIGGPPMDTLFQNTLQSLYHLVRLELGLIFENQIYAFPEMYNRSISTAFIPPALFGGQVQPVDYSAANDSRRSTSNSTVMAQWQESLRIFNDSNRVPVMPYLRPTPRLKPLGSAITSVFVSTFAMLSVLWTIFSIIAGAVAEWHSDDAGDLKAQTTLKSNSHIMRDLENQKGVTQDWDTSEVTLLAPQSEYRPAPLMMFERLSHGLEKNRIAIAEIQRALARMGLLKSSGLPEDLDEENRNEMEQELRDQAPERHSPLVHRANRGAVSDSLV
ncbi:hypothetical protein FB451DRAFT_1564935 [Mycena latifolia]|nr:hypothetical protein FB451DRAFT_1564935 [Mycena latifolia]